jgi:hypothetical protein
MWCDVDPDKFSALKSNDDEDIEQVEANCRGSEQIHGGDVGHANAAHHLRSLARQEAKPPSHARMVLRRFRKEVVLAGFAAEAQALMVVADKP